MYHHHRKQYLKGTVFRLRRLFPLSHANQHITEPGWGAGRGGCNLCGGGTAAEDFTTLPIVAFEQDETKLIYVVEFANEMHHSCWSVGMCERQFLFIKAVVVPPNIWLGHVKLKEPLEDCNITTEFDNDCRKIIITMVKPDDTVWRTLGTPLDEDNRILPSFEAPEDFYPAKITLKTKLASDHYLFAIESGGEFQFGIPCAWHMMLRIGEVYHPYTPIRFITQQQETHYSYLEQSKKRSEMTVTHFIVKVVPGGALTPALESMEIAKSVGLEIGSIFGRFDTDFVYDSDRLILFAAGSGLAPWTSIIRFIKDKPSIQVKQVILILSCRVKEAEDIIWHTIWDSLSLLDWFFYIPYATKVEPGSPAKRFTLESIKADLEQIPEPPGAEKPMVRRGMACGPAGFTDTCHEIFKALGFPDEDTLMFPG